MKNIIFQCDKNGLFNKTVLLYSHDVNFCLISLFFKYYFKQSLKKLSENIENK